MFLCSNLSALSVDRLFCWPDTRTAIAEARVALTPNHVADPLAPAAGSPLRPGPPETIRWRSPAGGDGSRVLARYMDDVDRVKNSPLIGIGL
ncbi:hypothetical protein ACWEBX_03125 [Streptomyces sp. NPDC005070]